MTSPERFDPPDIAARLLEWWDHARADLPWRRTAEPYAIWVAEVMLQQTQIATVIPYYERWLARFPTVTALAEASLAEVLKMWEGLGYYGRARHIHAAAQAVVKEYGGRLPHQLGELLKLKGIGRYTAGAIASIAFGQREPIVDGNITRVLARLLDLDQDVTAAGTRAYLWRVAAALVLVDRPGDFNQALMELGQVICLPGTPRCGVCPLAAHCLARQRGTQLERPVRPARRKVPHYDVTAAVIWGPDGRLLIARRPLDGLLGGLWEFPGGKREAPESLPAGLGREIREELALEIVVGRPLAPIAHAYTHFRITLYPFHAYWLAGRPRHLGVADHAWITLAEVDAYAFAATDRQIIVQLRSERGEAL